MSLKGSGFQFVYLLDVVFRPVLGIVVFKIDKTNGKLFDPALESFFG